MRGQTVHVGRGEKTYVNAYFRCSSYTLNLEVKAPTNCVNNRVRADQVESRLLEFLEQFGQQVHLDLQQAGAKLGHLLLPHGEKASLLRSMREEMLRYVMEHMPEEQHYLVGTEGGVSLLEAYQYYNGKELEARELEISKIEKKILSVLRDRRDVPLDGVAYRALTAEMNELEAEVVRRRAALIPLDKRIETISKQLQEIEDSIGAVLTCTKAKQTRQAAEALRRVVAKVEVFSVECGHAKRPAYSWIPERLVFHPVAGEPLTYKLDWPKHLIRPEAIARAKAIVKEQVKSGKVNLTSVAVTLQEEGYETPNGKPWGRSSLVKPLADFLATLPPEAMDARSRFRRKVRNDSDAVSRGPSSRAGRGSP
jgi:hypothetical protein